VDKTQTNIKRSPEIELRKNPHQNASEKSAPLIARPLARNEKNPTTQTVGWGGEKKTKKP